MHGLIDWNGPEGVEIHVDSKEPNNKSQSCQLGFKANGHQDHQSCAHDVLDDLHRVRGMTFKVNTRNSCSVFYKQTKLPVSFKYLCQAGTATKTAGSWKSPPGRVDKATSL